MSKIKNDNVYVIVVYWKYRTEWPNRMRNTKTFLFRFAILTI